MKTPRLPLAYLLLTLLGAAHAQFDHPKLNELVSAGFLNYVELYQAGGGSLDDHFLVVYSGSTSQPSAVLELGGPIPCDGFYVIGSAPSGADLNANFLLPTTTSGVALFKDPTGTLSSASFQTSVASPPASATLLDAAVYKISGGTEAPALIDALTPGAPHLVLSVTTFQGQGRDVNGGFPFDIGAYESQTQSPGEPNPGANLLRINEIDARTEDSNREFVELYKPGGGGDSLNNRFLVFYDGSDGEAYRVIDLDGLTVPCDGFFVVGDADVPDIDFVTNSTLTIQDGPDAVALYRDTTGALAGSQFIGTPASTPPAGALLLDAVVYGTGDGDAQVLLDALTPGQPQADESASGGDLTDSNQRYPDGGKAFDTSAMRALPATPGAPNAFGISTHVRLNEVAARDDDREFIELRGTPGTQLADYWVAEYDGSQDGTLIKVHFVANGTIGADGAFVRGDVGVLGLDTSFANPGDNLRDANTALVLWYDVTGALVAADFNGTSADAPPIGLQRVDAVLWTDDVAGESAAMLDTLAPGQSYVPHLYDTIQRSFEQVLASEQSSWSGNSPRNPGRVDPHTLRINEVDASGATAAAEFVELYDSKGLSLDDYVLVIADGTTGVASEVIALSGAPPANGYLVVGGTDVPERDVTLSSVDAIADTGSLVLLFHDLSGLEDLAMFHAADYRNDFPGGSFGGVVLIDAWAVRVGAPAAPDVTQVVLDEFTGAPPASFDSLDEDEYGLGLVTEFSLQRRPNGGPHLDSGLTSVDAASPGAKNVANFTDLGHALAGAGGAPLLRVAGSLEVDATTLFLLENAGSATSTNLVVGFSLANAPLKGGVLVPTPSFLLTGLPLFAGELPIVTPWPPELVGFPFSIYMQHWIADATGPQGFIASNGIRVN